MGLISAIQDRLKMDLKLTEAMPKMAAGVRVTIMKSGVYEPNPNFFHIFQLQA
tara:strand:- start:14688 stop:14846 length:159 start_codon:yes stop_codon:yes gene_type:complete